MNSWNTHNATTVETIDKDFKKLNRLACLNKVTNARGAKSFRQDLDYKLVKKYEKRPYGMENAQLVSKRSAQDLGYGRQNRPSTPVKAVIEG